MTIKKFKVTKVIDLNTLEVWFGIITKVDDKWIPCKDGPRPLYFKQKYKVQKIVDNLNSL